MAHPVRPDPYPCLESCKFTQGNTGSALEDHGVRTISHLKSRSKDLERASRLLREAGDTENGNWIEKGLEELQRAGVQLWRDSTSKFRRYGPDEHVFGSRPRNASSRP